MVTEFMTFTMGSTNYEGYAYLPKHGSGYHMDPPLMGHRKNNHYMDYMTDVDQIARSSLTAQISDFTSRCSPIPETDVSTVYYRDSDMPPSNVNVSQGSQQPNNIVMPRHTQSPYFATNERMLPSGYQDESSMGPPNYHRFGNLKVPQRHRISLLTDSPTGFRYEDYITNKVSVVRIYLCVWFVKIEEIDTQKEQFSADAIIKARWREPALDDVSFDEEIDWSQYWDPKLYIMNTLGELQQTKKKMRVFNDAGKSYVYEVRRIRGVFLENLELEDFPFDIQDLTITVGSERPDCEVEIVDDSEEPHTISTQFFVDAQEWYLYRHVYSETEQLEKRSSWGGDDKTWTVRLVKCRAARRPGYFIWNVFGLTFLICVLVFISFAVDQAKPQNRLLLNFTLLLTSVAAKSGLSKDLPKISYTTYSDRYMIGGMAFLTTTCLWHGLINILPETIEKATAEHVFLLSLAVVFVVFNIGYALCVYLFPYKRRRDMDDDERNYSNMLSNHKRKHTYYTVDSRESFAS